MLDRLLRTAARRYPLLSGYGTISSLPLFRSAVRDASEQWVKLRCGAKILVPPNDYVGRALYFFGDLDPKLSLVFRRLLRPGDTVLDIGANLGVMSLVACSLVGPSGAVHAFEPQPALAAKLRESGVANGYGNLHVHACALGADEGELELVVPEDNMGAASFVRGVQGTRMNVPVHRTSEYLATLKLGRIRLVKMDVEGFESSVIQGGMQFLAASPPDAIVFELNDHTTNFNEQPVVRLLRSLGYRFFNIPRAIFRLQLREMQGNGGHDVLAVTPSAVSSDWI
jgi:FkbM family methyltransferase